MGGGDLNLKKSWHPSTFQNLEKVWKAEQHHETEQKKIAQLQDELKEERAREEMQRTAEDSGLVPKRASRVEWLYSGPASSVNREEYLLGKKIDKMVDPTLIEQDRESQALASGPGALFVGDQSNATADLAVKVREDPLFLIKQKEEAAKKQLASNPVKLKQLQQLVSERKSKSKKKHCSKSSPKRKRKRSPTPPTPEHRHTHSRHDASSSRSSRRYTPYSRPVKHIRKQDSHTRSMDSEELKRRREEMMVAAQDHGRKRQTRLRVHEEEARKEESGTLKKEHKRSFLDPLRVQTLTSSSSLSDRIHRNIHSVQRTAAKLDSNFMNK